MAMFENVTGSSGLDYRGMTWSIAWRDVNGDGLPDLWLSSHNLHALEPGVPGVHLFLNLGNGHFADATRELVEPRFKDFHGASWADVDNDGDQDIAQMSDAKGGITLFENIGGTLQDHTADFNLLLGLGGISGRNPLWLDYNNDGLLDLYLGADAFWASGAAASGAVLLRQKPDGTFADARQEVGFNKVAAISPLLSDLTGDGHPELIITNYGQLTRIYDISGPTFVNITRSLLGNLTIPNFDDIVIADFNNDLRPDIYLTRQGYEDEVIASGKLIQSYIAGADSGVQRGFSFVSHGDLTFAFSRQDGSIKYNLIHVGSTATNPITDESNPSFTLSASDPGSAGLPANFANAGIYIGYDQPTDEWHYVVVGNARASRGVTINSTATISGLTTVGFPLHPQPASDQLLLNLPGGFVDATASSGIPATTIVGNHLAAGDFDNDGDVDIYIDRASPALNRQNIMLVNRGDGTFRVDAATGAEGAWTGSGGPVAVADYDRDGFLDLAITAGRQVPPFTPLNDGPLELFHNLGNGNHWIELRLHGTRSNADAIGAEVILTAGGHQQLREAMNGSHVEAQDYNDIHFGLGRSTTIDQLEVRWPSGAVTILRDVPADQIKDIVEDPATPPPDHPAPLPGRMGSLGDVPSDAIIFSADGGSFPADGDSFAADQGPFPGETFSADADPGAGDTAGGDAGGLETGSGDWLIG